MSVRFRGGADIIPEGARIWEAEIAKLPRFSSRDRGGLGSTPIAADGDSEGDDGKDEEKAQRKAQECESLVSLHAIDVHDAASVSVM